MIDGDIATGMLTFTVTAAGYMPATPDGLERDVLVWLDTDKNPLTGDPADGTDYELSAQTMRAAATGTSHTGTAVSGSRSRNLKP